MAVETQGLNAVMLIWGALTTITTLLGLVVGYFIKTWKQKTDVDISNLKKETKGMLAEEARCKLSVATNFVRKGEVKSIKDEMTETFNKIFDKMDGINKDMNDQHADVMYELGVKNGIKRTK